MGLDIVAYRGLVLVPAAEARDYGGDLRADYFVQVRADEKSFPGRAAGLVDGGYYRAVDSMYFRAGSYSGYGIWREMLAQLAGYPSDDDVWENDIAGPFTELINFSDCEGVIGPVVSAKLAKDFAEFQGKADSHPDDYFREKYNQWRLAFEMAADGGCVEFI